MSLTPFQMQTAKHAFNSLQSKKNARFLIADEVGLGKTIVAKEIIRKFLDQTAETDKKVFTVVYICNNQLLAKKNLLKLNPIQSDDKVWSSNIPPVNRLSLFPIEKFSSEKKKQKNDKRKICNFFALTPGTSLSLTRGYGIVFERLLLYYLARKNHPDLKQYQQGAEKGWSNQDSFFANNEDILNKISNEAVRLKYDDLFFPVSDASEIPGKRQRLSEFGAALLNPDLVIFDEFQNYEQIFFNDNIIKKDQEDQIEFRKEIDIINATFANAECPPKYLLLSATPFAPLTMNEDLARGEVDLSSCEAFCRLISWLNPGNTNFRENWQTYGKRFKEYCEDLKQGISPDESDLKNALECIQTSVTQVMCRTERPFEHLKKLVDGINLKTSVLNRTSEKKSEHFSGHPELAEFEKFVSYPLSAMGADYVTFSKFIRAHEDFYKFFLPEISDSMRSPYMQKLHDIMSDHKKYLRPLLWLPPTHPTGNLEGAFKEASDDGYSKILIFSQYRFIPRMISAALSNKFEQDYPAENKSAEYKFFDNRDGTELFRESARELLDPTLTGDLNQIFSSPAKSICWAFSKLLPETAKENHFLQRGKLWSVILAYSLIRNMLHSANIPYIEAVAGTEGTREKKAADYCRMGCFADAAYEYMYLLSQENQSSWTIEKIDSIGKQFYRVLHLKTNNLKLYTQKEQKSKLKENEKNEEKYARRVRTHFADCFSEKEQDSVNQTPENSKKQGNNKRTPIQTLSDVINIILGDHSADSIQDLLPGEQPDRNRELQSAFNSPFKPFVLSTTSIGQEGLDFHWYCRKIMHWNLPSNPVDFDQREGRINRYGSFALRQSLAQNYKKENFSWQEFWNDQENNAAEKNAGGMVPFWLPPTDHECSRKIERIIPFYPLSREHLFIDDLLKMQAVYRMVIGQPHQDEILSLLRNLSDEDRKKIMRYTLSLAPKDE